MGGQAAGGHTAARHGLDELLFRALRIADVQRQQVDAAAQHGGDGRDGLGLVLLDADGGALRLQDLQDDAQAADDAIGRFAHQAVVGRDVGLALRAVDDDGVDLAEAGGELDGRGEVSRPSDSMTMAVCRFPPGWGRASMAVTVPDTEAWTGTQRPWPSPIFWPTVTRSPTLTSGWQGAPMCCDMATETTLGCSGTMAASRESSL